MNEVLAILAEGHGEHLNPWIYLGISLFVHLLGWASFVIAWSGIRLGHTDFAFVSLYRPAKRVERTAAPIAFWYSIGFYAVGGLALTIIGAWGVCSATRELLAAK